MQQESALCRSCRDLRCVSQAGNRRYVLRKKPPGKVLASAHAVEREFVILYALASTSVPVPVPRALCTDSSVIGTPFYVMDHVQVGINCYNSGDSCLYLPPSYRLRKLASNNKLSMASHMTTKLRQQHCEGAVVQTMICTAKQ